MTRVGVFAVLLCAMSAAPARADLRYVTELRVVRVPDAPATDPRLAPIVGAIAEMLVPGGSVDEIAFVNENEKRYTFNKPTLGIPRDAFVIQRADGDILVNRTDRTWSRVPTARMSVRAGAAASFTRTGRFETIAGVRAEQVLVASSAQSPSGVVPQITLELSGELWLTDQFDRYRAVAMSGDAVHTLFGGDRASWPGGFVMRAVLHGTLLGAFQIERTITQIGEAPPPPDTYDVPADYTEVPFKLSPPPPPTAAAAVAPGPGVQPPRIIELKKPQYTPEAMRQRIEGTVRVSAIVMPDGSLRDVRVVKSLDPVYGLDAAAIACIEASRFEPGTRFGAPVAVQISVDVAFVVK